VRKSLAILQEVDPERRMAATREMTKVHEEVLRGTAEEILAALDDPPRGEFTLVFASD
jgi:16S rRNA (cytidine1402-2'-O)-methyltransferase